MNLQHKGLLNYFERCQLFLQTAIAFLFSLQLQLALWMSGLKKIIIEYNFDPLVGYICIVFGGC